MYNQVNISSGHSVNCQGAEDIINEVTEAKKVVDRVYEIIKECDKKVYKYHDTASSSNQNLVNIVNWHNQYSDGIDVSIHFNSCTGRRSEGIGVEVLYYNSTKDLAAVTSKNISDSSGLINRGAKQRTELYFLKNTKKPSILIEVCFVNSINDVELYRANFENICRAICKSLLGEIILPETSENVSDVISQQLELKLKVQEAKEFVGSRCKELQTKLIKLGYNCGGYGADGNFGQGTYNSLIKFQKDNGLDADGLAGAKTFAKLDELIAKKNQSTEDDWIRRLQSECNKQGFSNQKVDGIAGPATLNGCPMLKQGSNGNITKLLQEKLGISIDGIFGSETKKTVMNYQKSKGLSADGIVGKETWRKLLRL